jgi:hypothetical protein
MNENNKKQDDAMNNFDWRQHIKDVFLDLVSKGFDFDSPDSRTEVFLMAIWSSASMNYQDPHLNKIQVIVDSNDDLFVNNVCAHDDIRMDFTECKEIGLPIKCYIGIGSHGKAELRSEDWRKIRSGFGILDAFIVLGKNEYLVVQTKEERGEQFTYLAKKVFYGLLAEEIRGADDKSEEWI